LQIIAPMGLKSFNAHPASHFDSQCGVFFSTSSIHDGWAVLEFQGQMELCGEMVSVSLLFICVGWNRKRPFLISTIVDLSDCDSALLSQFYWYLEREVDDETPWILEESEKFGIPVQRHAKFRGIGENVQFTYAFSAVLDSSICQNEMQQVKIYVDYLD